MHRFVPREIEALKKQAKKLKKQLGCSHSHALDVIAQQNGYNKWSLLQKHSVAKDSRKDPARVFGVDAPPGRKRIIRVAAIRYATVEDLLRRHPGELVFRCPECKKIHSHGAVDWYLGAGDGPTTPHCLNQDVDYLFDLVEVLEPAFAGFLPKRILKHFAPPTADDHIKTWFVSKHTPAVDRSPWDGREGGYQYPTYDGAYDIHAVLCEAFPTVEEDTLFEIAEKLSEDGPWITDAFLRTLEEDAMSEI
ncbi:glyoxalase superfamily protein [Pseudodesulfovibrio sp.]|uniref:glyoxalase superfamily protein n=1 Tax=unclassified Pseudodesulfovibrio TaxID=2661612 RepID=UPI003B00DBC6